MHVLGKRAGLIDWNEAVAEFRSLQEDSACPPLRRTTRTYRRSDEEVTVATEVVDVARQLGQLRGMVLLQRAASSIGSLEDSLVRWVEEPAGDLKHIEALEQLLQRVEQLHVDSRLECFKGLVGELAEAGTRHVVAFCQYRATLDYLAAAVERLDFTDIVLHGDMTCEGRLEAVSRFEAKGGLLITTAVASEGASLNFVEAAIHYDLPMSPVAFAQREGRYQRYGSTLPCTVYFLEDETGALRLEDLLLSWARAPGLVTDEIDVGGVFRAAVT